MARGEWRRGGWLRYVIEMWTASAVYVVSVMLTVWLTRRYEPEGAALVAVAMLPMVGALLMLWAFLRQFWRTDELQRRVVAEAVVVTAGVVGFGSFALGWVQAVMELRSPLLSLIWVLPAMCVVWWPALYFVRRRYS